MSKTKVIKHGYKFKLYPTEDQKEKINDFINYTRFVYNWGVAKEYEIYEQHKQNPKNKEKTFYTYYDLDTLFQKEINENPDLKWIKENKYPRATTKLPFRNLYNGYIKFFDKCNKGKPRFKKKNKCKKSFNTRNDRFYVRNNKIKIEGIKSEIDLGFDCGLNISRAINPVITLDNLGDYYVSFNLEEEIEIDDVYIPKSEGIGIDLGDRQTFVLSNGEVYNQPKEKLYKIDKQIARLDQQITRDRKRRKAEAKRTKTKYEDIPKSKRQLKREFKRAKKYRKAHNIKNTFYHTITRHIVDKKPAFICMETFRVREMQRDEPYMNKYLVKTSYYTITQMIKYKCENADIPFIQAPREFASTQICNHCGNKKKMYNYHTYKCPVCGMVEDRDINAAINLRNYGSQFMIQ